MNQSNPYYIVQQGQVDRLMAMKDSERLELLKDIAGTSVYDMRRKESLKIMQETQAKLDDVQQIITYIDDRIKDLESQKKGLFVCSVFSLLCHSFAQSFIGFFLPRM